MPTHEACKVERNMLPQFVQENGYSVPTLNPTLSPTHFLIIPTAPLSIVNTYVKNIITMRIPVTGGLCCLLACWKMLWKTHTYTLPIPLLSTHSIPPLSSPPPPPPPTPTAIIVVYTGQRSYQQFPHSSHHSASPI